MTTADRPVNILIFTNLGERHLAQIRAVDPRVRVTLAAGPAHRAADPATAETMLACKVPRDAVQNANRLKWIHSTAAAVDDILYPEAYERDPVLTSSSGIHPP